jgi:hypothetical protein
VFSLQIRDGRLNHALERPRRTDQRGETMEHPTGNHWVAESESLRNARSDTTSIVAEIKTMFGSQALANGVK